MLRPTKTGLAHHKVGEFPQAVEDYNEAIRLNTEFDVVYAKRAVAYILLDTGDMAERDIEQAVNGGFNRAVIEREIDTLRRIRYFT